MYLDSVEGYDNGELADYESIVGDLKQAVEAGKWIEAIAAATKLWKIDWADHLGRDFTEEGCEPEHARRIP